MGPYLVQGGESIFVTQIRADLILQEVAHCNRGERGDCLITHCMCRSAGDPGKTHCPSGPDTISLIYSLQPSLLYPPPPTLTLVPILDPSAKRKMQGQHTHTGTTSLHQYIQVYLLRDLDHSTGKHQ